MSGAYSRSLWYAEGLRWIGSLLVDAAEHLELRAAEHDANEPWPEVLPPHERVFELRNRIGFY